MEIGKWLRILSVAFSLALTLVLVIAAYSLLPTNFAIDVSSDVSVDVNPEDGILELSVPVTIDNRGFFDIHNLLIRIEAANSTGAPVFVTESVPVDILGASTFNQNLVLTVNLTDTFLASGSYHLFNSDTFNVTISIFCRYAISLFGIAIRIPNIAFPWAAPLHGFYVNLTHLETIPHATGTAVNATFAVTHSGWVTFNQTQVQTHISHTNGTLITTNSTHVDLGPGTTYHAFIFPISNAWATHLQNHNETLFVNATFFPVGVPITTLHTFDWEILLPPSIQPFESSYQGLVVGTVENSNLRCGLSEVNSLPLLIISIRRGENS